MVPATVAIAEKQDPAGKLITRSAPGPIGIAPVPAGAPVVGITAAAWANAGVSPMPTKDTTVLAL